MLVRIHLVALVFLCAGTAGAQDQKYTLAETFAPGSQYHVSCRGQISGSMTETPEKGAARDVKITGSSSIEYDERILGAERTLRQYSRLDFERRVDKEEQLGNLRPDVSRLVIMRQKQLEVPFSPDGPMTLGELQLIRTDVFTPALKGLLPTRPVTVGQRWDADRAAVQELTDLEKIIQGGFDCTLQSIDIIRGRRQAQVSFEGKVRGVGEDGNALHELKGGLVFDLDSNLIAYVSVNGTHQLLDKDGKKVGQIEGSFTLTREPRPRTQRLADAAIAGVKLEPNDDNTLLRFDDPALGIAFNYPRNWHVAGTNPKDRQVGIDEKNGSGLLLVVDTAKPKGDAVKQFQQAVVEGLKTQKAKANAMTPPTPVQPGLTGFSVDADFSGRRVRMQYYVIQQPAGTATVTAPLQGRDLATVQRDAERIVRSVQLSAPR